MSESLYLRLSEQLLPVELQSSYLRGRLCLAIQEGDLPLRVLSRWDSLTQAPLLSSPNLFYYFFPLKNVLITFQHPHFSIVCVDSPLSPQVLPGRLPQGRAFFFLPLYQVLAMHLTLPVDPLFGY